MENEEIRMAMAVTKILTATVIMKRNGWSRDPEFTCHKLYYPNQY